MGVDEVEGEVKDVIKAGVEELDVGGIKVLSEIDGVEIGVRFGNEKDVDVDVKPGVDTDTLNCQHF